MIAAGIKNQIESSLQQKGRHVGRPLALLVMMSALALAFLLVLREDRRGQLLGVGEGRLLIATEDF
jgi:hypothetical protein